MSDTAKLGQIHSEPQGRDAVHIAIAPCVAGQILAPGDHVGLEPGSTESVIAPNAVAPAIGIVDPFIHKRFVAVGERFYVFLYPQTITGLRHVWTHERFPDDEREVRPGVFSTPDPEIDRVSRYLGWSYQEVLDRAAQAAESNCSLHTGDNEYYEGSTDEFWDAVYRLTGKRHRDGVGKWFSCAC